MDCIPFSPLGSFIDFDVCTSKKPIDQLNDTRIEIAHEVAKSVDTFTLNIILKHNQCDSVCDKDGLLNKRYNPLDARLHGSRYVIFIHKPRVDLGYGKSTWF